MQKSDIKEITMATGDWNKTKAFVTVTFENGLLVNGIKVLQGTKGLFVGMPQIQRKQKDSDKIEYKDCCYFLEDDRKLFSDIILEAYNDKIGGKGSSSKKGGTPKEDDSSFF